MKLAVRLSLLVASPVVTFSSTGHHWPFGQYQIGDGQAGNMFMNSWLIVFLYDDLCRAPLCWPLSSDRQHLSYDVYLEVRGEIIRTVLCCIVY